MPADRETNRPGEHGGRARAVGDGDPLPRLPSLEDGSWRGDRVAAARAGRNPTVLARLASGWAVLGDHQRLPGYCVLLHDGDCTDLLQLSSREQALFLSDMTLVGDVVSQVCAARDPMFLRVNFEILMNHDPLLHAHVRPRYAREPPELRRRPAWFHPDLTDAAHRISHAHDEVRAQLMKAFAAAAASTEAGSASLQAIRQSEGQEWVTPRRGRTVAISGENP